jgi:hypothetical protein
MGDERTASTIALASTSLPPLTPLPKKSRQQSIQTNSRLTGCKFSDNLRDGNLFNSDDYCVYQWQAIDRPADTRRFVSLPVMETGGIYDREPKFRDAERGDVRLTERTADGPGVRDEPVK